VTVHRIKTANKDIYEQQYLFYIMNNSTRDDKHCKVSEVFLAIQPKCICTPTLGLLEIYLIHSTNDCESNFICNVNTDEYSHRKMILIDINFPAIYITVAT